MTVYLVPIGRDRFELYSETPVELAPAAAPGGQDGLFRQWTHKAIVRWHSLVDTARRGSAGGRLARWRDTLVCRLAETIAEQRTLWALRFESSAVARFPSMVQPPAARAVLNRALAHGRRHHFRWMIVELILFILSGVFFFVPGPNLIAYYLAFRLMGHLQSWRGARRGMERVIWTLEPDSGLAELASLVDLPRATRAPRVAAIAARLDLPRLSAFFDRVASPSA